MILAGFAFVTSNFSTLAALIGVYVIILKINLFIKNF